MRFSFKLSIANVVLVVVTTLIAVILSHHYTEKEVISRELKVLERRTNLIGERISSVVEDTRLQVLAIASMPAIKGIIRAQNSDDGIDPYDGTTEMLWQERLQTIFAGHLSANPNYFQIRYIGLEDDGREIVRVDRGERRGSIRITEEDSLAQKGGRSYFKEALETPFGEVYISDIELNREQGEIVKPYVPTIRLAYVVHEEIGRPFGMVVINVDLREVFNEATQLPVENSQVYLADDDGDFILHNDSSQLFGSEFGRPGLFQETFPTPSDGGSQTNWSTVVTHADGEKFAVGCGVAPLDEHHKLYSVITIPYADVIASVSEIKKSGYIAALVTGLLAVCLSILLSRTIANPIRQITNVIQKYSFMDTIELPKSTTTEFNMLSQSLEKMAAKIRDQANDLEHEAGERLQSDARSEARSTFLANMSHEIRTPMNGVVSMTELLNMTELSDEQRNYTQILERSAGLLLTVIDDILDFSKIEAGKLQIETIPVSPQTLVHDVVGLLRSKAEEKNLKLVHVVDADVPSKIIGDPVRLRQILINLVGNSLKFTDSGEVTIHLSVIRQNGNQIGLRVEVTDTGIGIPQERLDTIFESFGQADSSTTRNFGGSGLGLTISKNLVELMGGSMHVSSEVGKGSQFWFDLTTVAVMRTENERIEKEQHNVEQAAEFAKKKILVAEDNEVNQFVVSRVLGIIGCPFDIVVNGEDAVAAVQANDYDLVLMDCHMPVMDGMDATKEIRALGGKFAELPIVALTAGVMDDDVERCIGAGMSDHMSKPVRCKVLKAVLCQHLKL